MKRSTKKTVLAYHFVGPTLRDGKPIPKNRVWLKFEGEPILCQRGLHASKHPFDALQYAPGNTLCLVELRGKIVKGEDKLAATERRIIKRINAEPLMREFARWSALQVIELWDAPEVVKEYLQTGDAAKRDAAWAAARAAAGAAAWAAARAAAWAAAWAAEGAAAWAAEGAAAAARAAAGAAAWATARGAAKKRQRTRFLKMVKGAFGI